MINIEWVVVSTTIETRAMEFQFALAELRRQIPGHAHWVMASESIRVQRSADVGPQSLVLLLEHPWITLEKRCLERLHLALSQGFDMVEACDSRFFAPMGSGGYATLRGMERFVDQYPFQAVELASQTDAPKPLVRLTTVDTFRCFGHGSPRAARVSGAYAHDVSSYFASDRSDILDLIPPSCQRFLDVGGGEGNFLKLIKSSRGGETHLVEMDSEAAGLARQDDRADHVAVMDFLAYESSLTFDCISFLDMLEHVPFPERYLAHTLSLLSVRGVVIASIPNVGHWSVVADLLEGRWDYVPTGIHCVTHLRFFTLKTIEDLFDRAGFKIERIESVLVPCPPRWVTQWQQSSDLQTKQSSLDTYAYLIVGHPKIRV